MIPSKSFQDEIPDSMFRDMFRKNAFSLLSLTIISVALSIFFYFKIMNKNYISVYHVNIKSSDSILDKNSTEHQKFIRLLKSDKVRKKVISDNDLTKYYGLNTERKHYEIQLDKYLFDNLKVEEQTDGCILIRYKNTDKALSQKVIFDLIQGAIFELNLFAAPQKLQINIVKNSTIKENNKWHPKIITLSLLVTAPVLLIFIILIAIKEKMFLDLNNKGD
jgi:hypothetical protein